MFNNVKGPSLLLGLMGSSPKIYVSSENKTSGLIRRVALREIDFIL